jgi:hypothetical protein
MIINRSKGDKNRMPGTVIPRSSIRFVMGRYFLVKGIKSILPDVEF